MQELLEILGIPYTASGPSACMRCWDKVLAKHALRDAGHPDARLLRLQRDGVQELGAAHALPAIEERLGFPIVVKPAAQGSALGIKFAPHRRRRAGRARRRVLLRPKVLLERYVAGRDLAVSVARRADGPEALPVVEAVPRGGDLYDFEARYEIGRTDVRLPGGARRRDDRGARRSWRSPPTRARLRRLRARRPDARRRDRRADGARGERDPGLTETSLLPQAAEAAGHRRSTRFVERVLDARRWRASAPRLTRRGVSSLLAARREVLRRDLVEEVLELVDDLLGVLDLVLELDRRLGDHVLGGEDRRAGADRERERVARPRVDLDLAAVDRQRDRGVEGVLAQLGDGDARAARRRARRASRRAGRASSAAASTRPEASSGSPRPPDARSRSAGTC